MTYEEARRLAQRIELDCPDYLATARLYTLPPPMAAPWWSCAAERGKHSRLSRGTNGSCSASGRDTVSSNVKSAGNTPITVIAILPCMSVPTRASSGTRSCRAGTCRCQR